MNDPEAKAAPYYVRKGGGFITHIVVDRKVLCGAKATSVRGRFYKVSSTGGSVCPKCQAALDKQEQTDAKKT